MKEKGKQKSKKVEWEEPKLTSLSKGAWSAGDAVICKGGSANANGCKTGYLGPKYVNN